MDESGKRDLTLSSDVDSSLLNWSEDPAPGANGGQQNDTMGSTANGGVKANEAQSQGAFLRLPSFQIESETQKEDDALNRRKAGAAEGGRAASIDTVQVRSRPASGSPLAAPVWEDSQPAMQPQQIYANVHQQQGQPPVTLPQQLVIHPFMPVVAHAGAISHGNRLMATSGYVEAVSAPASSAMAANTPASSGHAAPQVSRHHQQLYSQHSAFQEQTAQRQRASSITSSLTPHHLPPYALPTNPQAATIGSHGNTSLPVMFSAYQALTSSNTKIPSAKSNAPKSTKDSSSTTAPPPFMLFDAPCELRTNFIQSQRMHGLPVTEDNNSYHYGMAVNGFHPQVNARENPILPLSASHSVGSGMPVHLVDGRHSRGKRPGARERNEREQKRAQKITDLIEQLRLSIESGGWRVEMKSKYHTLLTCSDYVKHLIKTTQEKEAALEQAKLDLTAKECKLAEDSAQQDSDPGSVTSSLTASTRGSGRRGNIVSANDSLLGKDKEKKRERTCSTMGEPPLKKMRSAEASQPGGVSPDTSSGEEGGSGVPNVQNISLDKMSSSVSEMTDSNRGSSDGDKAGVGEAACSDSISSTAAVVRGEGSSDRPHGHADVVIRRKRTQSKQKRKELTSLEKDFQLDYEEVFLQSNVPQLIATPTGKIAVWNDFFLKATGLEKSEVEGMTIFSIVHTDKLSNLFEMIGRALKREESVAIHRDSCEKNSGTSSASAMSGNAEITSESNGSSSVSLSRFTALTLPCISFPASKEQRELSSSHHPNPLYMTVTLMPDEDPRKRCFHCMLTDCPGTNGALGSITPELLALLFADHDSGST